MITEQRHIKSKDIIRVAGDVCESWNSFPSVWKLISEKSNIAPPLSCQIKLNTQESCCFPKVEIDIREQTSFPTYSIPPPMSCCVGDIRDILKIIMDIIRDWRAIPGVRVNIDIGEQTSFPTTYLLVLLSLTLEISEMILGISVVGDIIRCRIPWLGSSLGAPRLFWAPGVNILHRNIFWSVRLPDGPPFSDSWSVLTSRFFVDRKNGFHLHRKRKLKMFRKKSVWREKTSYQRERSFLRYSRPVLTSCHTESPACSLPSL